MAGIRTHIPHRIPRESWTYGIKPVQVFIRTPSGSVLDGRQQGIGFRSSLAPPESLSEIRWLLRQTLPVVFHRHDLYAIWSDDVNQAKRPLQYFAQIVLLILRHAPVSTGIEYKALRAACQTVDDLFGSYRRVLRDVVVDLSQAGLGLILTRRPSFRQVVFAP